MRMKKFSNFTMNFSTKDSDTESDSEDSENETDTSEDEEEEEEYICQTCFNNETIQNILLNPDVQKVIQKQFSSKQRKQLNECSLMHSISISNIQHTLKKQDKKVIFRDIVCKVAWVIFEFVVRLLGFLFMILRVTCAACCLILTLSIWFALNLVIKLCQLIRLVFRYILIGLKLFPIYAIYLFHFLIFCPAKNYFLSIKDNSRRFHDEFSKFYRTFKEKGLKIASRKFINQLIFTPAVSHAPLQTSRATVLLVPSVTIVNNNQNNAPNIDQLVNKAESAMERKSFSFAVKHLCLAIERLFENRQLFQMKHVEKCRLVKLYVKRAECNLELARLHRSERNVNLALEDCDFLINTESLRSAGGILFCLFDLFL
jgi:hypothetical protein